MLVEVKLSVAVRVISLGVAVVVIVAVCVTLIVLRILLVNVTEIVNVVGTLLVIVIVDDTVVIVGTSCFWVTVVEEVTVLESVSVPLERQGSKRLPRACSADGVGQCHRPESISRIPKILTNVFLLGRCRLGYGESRGRVPRDRRTGHVFCSHSGSAK